MKFAFLERSLWLPCGKYIAGDTGQELKVVWSRRGSENEGNRWVQEIEQTQ